MRAALQSSGSLTLITIRIFVAPYTGIPTVPHARTQTADPQPAKPQPAKPQPNDARPARWKVEQLRQEHSLSA